jgi:hypothetical protein
VSAVGRIALFLLGIVVVLQAEPTRAQDLDTGKSGQQLFAANCAACHRTPRGQAKRNRLWLFFFLREHYTASQASARELAAYLSATSGEPSRPKQKSVAARPQPPTESRWDFSWLGGRKQATAIKRSKRAPRPPADVPNR